MELKEIAYGSADYRQTLALRNRVMRRPLGMDISKEDFSCEEGMYLLGAFEGERLLGVGVMSSEGTACKLEYLCVDTDQQGTGVGAELLHAIEQQAAARQAEKLYMEARVSAQQFYENRGYRTVGDIYIMKQVPVIDHILMEKSL